MIEKEIVLDIINKELNLTELFLVDVKISKDNKISVFIDGDNGVNLQNCIDLSRAIEGSLDRDKEDYELSVMSFGVGEPLKLLRQYKKNIGRNISILKNDGESFKGSLVGVDGDKIIVETSSKKKKEIIIKETFLEEIKEGKILVIF